MSTYISFSDGIGTGRLALRELGIKFDKYYASEIDKYAIAISKCHFPDTIHLGDINNWQEWNVDWSDVELVTNGTSCKSFSYAGKQEGFNSIHGQLFLTFVDILNHIKKYNPKVKFLVENTPMNKISSNVFSEKLGVEYVKINSSLVSAQHRERLYWANFPITQPKDEGIMLFDILESDPIVKGGDLILFDEPKISKNGLWQVGTANIKGWECIKRVYHPSGKSPTLNANTGGNREPKILHFPREPYDETYKSNLPVNYKKEKFHTLRANAGSRTRGIGLCNDAGYWRKLTTMECTRLQTFPDGYVSFGNFDGKIKKISPTQQYKTLGNAWTLDVIKHIFDNMQ